MNPVMPLLALRAFAETGRRGSIKQAAETMGVTSGAVSQQIRLLEARTGTALFSRTRYGMQLTEAGARVHGQVLRAFDQLAEALGALEASAARRTLTVTTAPSFAASWLIPRLGRFTKANPQIDVRIVANDRALNLDRSLVDIAIRYCQRGMAPADAVPLFGEDILPVCSPLVLNDPATPLRRPEDLKHHTLLHLDYPGMKRTWYDWGTWLTSFGMEDLKPAGTLHFSRYEQLIQAAVSGQGVALGLSPLINEPIRSGLLAAPFDTSVVGPRGYFLIRSTSGASKPQVDDFCRWVMAEAGRDAAGPDRA